MRRPIPPLLPDRRAEVLARWDAEVSEMRGCPWCKQLVPVAECTDMGTHPPVKTGEVVEVRVTPKMWRLMAEVSAAGWANAAALRKAGAWRTR